MMSEAIRDGSLETVNRMSLVVARSMYEGGYPNIRAMSSLVTDPPTSLTVVAQQVLKLAGGRA